MTINPDPNPMRTIERYVAFWNAETGDEQRRIAADAYSDEIEFATGTDVLRLTPDGRITDVTAFLDRAPDGFGQHDEDAANPVARAQNG